MSREPQQPGQPPGQEETEHPGAARQPRRGGQAQIPDILRVAVTLMDTVARTEQDIAETLHDLAAHDQGKTAARRLKLADDAIRGAQEAHRRSKRLQELGQQWAEHAGVVKLHQLLADAAQALTGLARTHEGIAEAFASLARQDGSELAAQRRQLAAAAAANARKARAQARELRELAATSPARTHHPTPPTHD